MLVCSQQGWSWSFYCAYKHRLIQEKQIFLGILPGEKCWPEHMTWSGRAAQIVWDD